MELRKQYDALFFTISETTSITSLKFKDCNLGNLNQCPDDDYRNYSLPVFINEISKSPITSLSISNDNLDKWSEENWLAFLEAIKLSKTISVVEVDNTQLSIERHQQLTATIEFKNQENRLAMIVAKSIANNIMLFKKEDLEKLPEPCLERIQYYSKP